MILDLGGATAVVGTVAALVAGWGAWFSTQASRRGPAWARSHLDGARTGPWLLALAGLGASLAVEPVWVGVGILYIAAVTGFLMRQVRRRLEATERAYGPLDVAPRAGSRPGPIRPLLLGGGAVLAVIGVVDVAVRGWSGVFAVALAVSLVVAGFAVRR